MNTINNSNILPDNLILKSVKSKKDIIRIAEFNKNIHEGVNVDIFVETLITRHPAKKAAYWLFIEDTEKNLVVSSICLIPWTVKFCGVTLKAAELGFVGTLPEYRSKGLINILMQEFFKQAEKDGFIMSIIQGIPYYYRRFGYDYAIPLENHFNLELRHIPENKKRKYSFVKAGKKDIPVLFRYYNQKMKDYDISAVRTKKIWEYLLGPAQKTETIHENFLIKNRKNGIVGYFRIAHYGFGRGLRIDETSRLNSEMAGEILVFAGELAVKREIPYVQLILPIEHELVAAAKSCEARTAMLYGWQVKVLDIIGLLKKMKSMLEKRIDNSMFRGMTKKLLFNYYTDTIELDIKEGKVVSIQSVGFHELEGVRIPPFAVPQLLFGWKTFEELDGFFPDVGCPHNCKGLVNVLFPKLSGYLHLMY